MTHDYAALVTIEFPAVLRFATFNVDVEVRDARGGNPRTFEAGKLESVGAIQNQTGSPSRRATVRVRAVDASDRAALLRDNGPVKVEVEFARSRTVGLGWVLMPKKLVGKLSATTVSEGYADLTIETAKGTVWAGEVLTMTDAVQRATAPLGPNAERDRAFEYAQRFREEGILEHPPPQ